MSELIDTEMKDIFLQSFRSKLEGLDYGSALGVDDESFIRDLMELRSLLANVSRDVVGFHPELRLIWEEVANELEFVAPLDETRPMKRGDLPDDHCSSEEDQEERLDNTLALLVRDIPAEARKPETASHSTILETVTTGRHQRPDAQAS